MKAILCKSCYATLNPEQKLFVGGNTLKCEYCGTVHVIESTSPLTRDYSTIKDHRFIVFLRDKMALCFDLESLRVLCTNLVAETGNRSFEYDNLRGEAKTSKCQAFVETAYRHDSINALVKVASNANRSFALAVEGYVF